MRVSVIRIAGVLTLICTLVAALLSFVYALTDDVYEQNLRRTKEAAVAALYGRETVSAETLPAEGVQELYRVTDGDVLLGYCANVKSPGFGGDIDMMVAVDADGVLLGVKIVSMSETPGLGSRVGNADHLAQYVGVSTDEVLTLDAISGATVSSRAVHAGVEIARAALAAAGEGRP